MSNNVFFRQHCPACGQHMHIPIESLGAVAQCTRCRKEIRCDASTYDRLTPTENRLLVLIMDSGHREQIARDFSANGYQVTVVGHPRHALEVASFRSFEAVITDFAVPEFTGKDFVRMLRMRIKNARIIARVNVHDSESALQAIGAGAFACASCECPFSELAQVAENAVDDARMVSANPTAFRIAAKRIPSTVNHLQN